MTTLQVPGLLLKGNWIPPVRVYEGVGISSLAEIVFSERDSIFPNHYVSMFDLLLAQDIEEPFSADLAVVSRNLDAWYLLFVESSRNADLDSLLAKLRSVQILNFETRVAWHLKERIVELDSQDALRVLQERPRLVVVTDDPKNDWDHRLAKLHVSADVMIVEPFLHGGSYILRVNGQNPAHSAAKVIATCVEYESYSGCLKLTWSDPVPPLQPGTISLEYGEARTEWDLYLGHKTWLLFSQGTFPLKESPPFQIVEDADGTHSIRKTNEEA